MTRYLIDTHVYIWLSSSPEKLKPQWHNLLADSNNHIYLSMASIWEMQIKYLLGKLKLAKPLEELISDIKNDGLYHILPIAEQHIFQLQNIPNIHKDPFDRMLISQAIHEKLTLITDDAKIMQYPVTLL